LTDGLNWSYNSSMASIRDVAKEAGVSPATVSRTFTTPDLINEDTRGRVLAAARLLDYRPPRLRHGRRSPAENGLDYSLSRRGSRIAAPDTSDAIGFQFFHRAPEDALLSNVFYAPVLAGAQAEAEALGLHILLHSTDIHAIKDGLPRMVTEGAVRGLLLVGIPEAEVLEQFARQIPALVLVDNPNAAGPYERVLSDGFGGGYAAAQYLMELGHRRLGFFLAERDTATFRDRMHGWLAAQFDAGILPDPTRVVAGEDDTRRAAALRELLTRPDRPTALMTANDHYAVDALRLCREMGLRVPRDLSIIGFDDVVFSASTHPPLSTLHVETVLMGRIAVRRLLAQIKGDPMESRVERDDSGGVMGIRHVVPVSLIPRGTTAPPGVSV
jgi:DNA-binding LacI/PurR family transcriptional regulator